MTDIVPELLERIQKEYADGVAKSVVLQAVKKKIDDKKATYDDAYNYALEIGKILAAVYKRYLTAESMPDGQIYYNIASRVLEPTMRAAYEDVTAVCMDIQSLINQKSGFGLKAVKPELNTDRVKGLINKVTETEDERQLAEVS